MAAILLIRPEFANEETGPKETPSPAWETARKVMLPRWELAMPAAVVGAAATVIVAGVVARAVVAVIVARVVVGAVVVPVVVLMPHPVVVLERVERGADVRLDGELVRRIRRVEDGGARGEPGARVEVDGDVLALAVDHELAFQLLLGLERGGELERGAVEGAVDQDRRAGLHQIVGAGNVVGALQAVDLQLDLVVGARGNRGVEHLLDSGGAQIGGAQVDDDGSEGDLSAVLAVARAKLEVAQGDADASEGNARGGRGGGARGGGQGAGARRERKRRILRPGASGDESDERENEKLLHLQQPPLERP